MLILGVHPAEWIMMMAQTMKSLNMDALKSLIRILHLIVVCSITALFEERFI